MLGHDCEKKRGRLSFVNSSYNAMIVFRLLTGSNPTLASDVEDHFSGMSEPWWTKSSSDWDNTTADCAEELCAISAPALELRFQIWGTNSRSGYASLATPLSEMFREYYALFFLGNYRTHFNENWLFLVLIKSKKLNEMMNFSGNIPWLPSMMLSIRLCAWILTKHEIDFSLLARTE